MPSHRSPHKAYVIQQNLQTGFILLPVVMAIALIAGIAFLMNREGAMAVNELGSEIDTTQASLVAKAGMSQMLWQANNANCTGYSNLNTVSFGTNSYSATISPTSSSPVSIKATGTDAKGASYTINRDRVKVYQPYTTLTLQLGTNAGMDASISSLSSTSNYGASSEGITRIGSSILQNQLIQFDLSGLSSNTTIVSATLQLFQSSVSSTTVISAHRLTKTWLEGTKNGSGTADGVTWKTTDGGTSWTTNGGDYDTSAITSTTINTNSNTLANWDITSLVQDWVSGKAANYGLLLNAQDNVIASFASKEDSTVANRPKLIILYTCECGQICSLAQKVYWTDDTANKIQMSDADGSNVEDLITGLDRPTGIDVDAINGKIYWANNMQIMRANLDGTNAQSVYTDSFVTMDIKLDAAGGKMYWTHDNGTSLVMRANLDGTSSQTLNTTLSRPAFLSLNTSAGFMYLTNFGNGTVARMNLDGTGVTNLVSSQGTPIGSAFDAVNGKIYWSAGSASTWIRRSNLDGTTIQTIVTGLTAPQDIVYDDRNNRIFWVDGTAKKVQRSNPDGTNLTTLVSTGLTRPRGIALVNAQLVGKNRTLTLNPVADTDIYQGSTGTNYGTSATVWSGRASGAGNQYKGLLKFDVSGIPSGSTITSATLRLNQNGSVGSGSFNLGIYKILSNWAETTANWTNMGAASNYNSTQLVVAADSVGSTGFKVWNLPVGLINEWIDGVPGPNYGLSLVYESTTAGNYFQFASKEDLTAASRPQLIINYTKP